MQDGEYIFVLDQTNTNLYVAKKVKGYFHHSSFVAGAPVTCAGMLELRSGEIYDVYLFSGHYKPTKEDGEEFENTSDTLVEWVWKPTKKIFLLGDVE